MAGNKIICTEKNVEYIDIRKAMCQNARTKEEIKEITGACLECESCQENLDWILASVCGCNNVSLEDVVNAVKDGATTVEAVGQITKAGIECERCQVLVKNIIEIGR